MPSQPSPCPRRRALTGALLGASLGLAPPAWAQTDAAALTGGDPFGSMVWPDLRREFLGAAPVVFDPRVVVSGPLFAEDAMNVPITVSADALPGVQQIMVLVDRNPIRKVLDYFPTGALPRVSFRFKLEQASAVRAIARTRDGVWHAGGTWVDASGGGCTVAGASRRDGSWSQTLGQVAGRLFDAPAAAGQSLAADPAGTRLRFRVMHPMDTGLVAGIPAFHIDKLQVADAQGQVLLRMNLFEPVSENPVFSFDFPGLPRASLLLTATDNNGNRVQSRIVQ